MKRTFIAFVAVLAAAAVVSSPVWAFRMIQNTSVGRVTAGAAVTCTASGGFTHWTISSIPWRHNLARQGGEAGTAAAIQNALASWTNVSGANHSPFYAGTTTAGWATDGTNTMLWAKGNGCSGNCLALTALVLQAGQVIVETDITYNDRWNWNTNGSNYDVEAVAAHEVGHALGIHHTEVTSSPLPTMYAAYIGTGGRTLESDDNAALQCSQSRYPV